MKTTSSSLLAVLVLALASPAFAANPSPQDFATARELYKQGKDLRAAGDLRGAFEKLKAAHALGHTPLTGIELARTEVLLGLLVEARETCLGIARLPVESDETERSAEARTDAAKLAEELRPRLATLRLHVTSQAAAIVTVDGETVPSVSVDEPRLVNPGHHVVTAHVEGGTNASSAVDVTEGSTQDVALAPPPAPIAIVTHDHDRDHDHDDHSDQTHHGLGAVTIAGITIASAGLVVGSIGGIVAMSSSVNTSVCPNYQCTSAAALQDLNSARSAALASTIGFSVAGAGIVLLVVGLVTHTSSKESMRGIRIVPDLGFDHIGVSGAF
jgi:hypothetical protein